MYGGIVCTLDNGGSYSWTNKGINNSFNAANITNIERDSYVCNIGGIVYFAGSPIKNCYNTGNINDRGVSAGIVENGYNIIKNCFNMGNIYNTQTFYTGGIVTDHSGGNIENCYNLGNVTGRGNVGGIAGRIMSSSGIYNCYNSGKISLFDAENNTNNSIGAITSWRKYTSTKIENCKYLTGSASYGIGSNQESLYTIQSTDTLPTILEVVNKENVFVQEEGDLHPVFYWQKHPDILRDKSIN